MNEVRIGVQCQWNRNCNTQLVCCKLKCTHELAGQSQARRTEGLRNRCEAARVLTYLHWARPIKWPLKQFDGLFRTSDAPPSLWIYPKSPTSVFIYYSIFTYNLYPHDGSAGEMLGWKTWIVGETFCSGYFLGSESCTKSQCMKQIVTNENKSLMLSISISLIQTTQIKGNIFRNYSNGNQRDSFIMLDRYMPYLGKLFFRL